MDHQQPGAWHAAPNAHSRLFVPSRGCTGSDLGWTDTVLVGPGGTVRIAVEFTHDCTGSQTYLLHCHDLEHEDAGMMVNFRGNAWVTNETDRWEALLLPDPMCFSAIPSRLPRIALSVLDVATLRATQRGVEVATSVSGRRREPLSSASSSAGSFMLALFRAAGPLSTQQRWKLIDAGRRVDGWVVCLGRRSVCALVHRWFGGSHRDCSPVEEATDLRDA